MKPVQRHECFCLLTFNRLPFTDRLRAQYSVVSLGWNLPNSSDAPNSLGVRWIQVAFLLFALIVPVVHIFIMLALVR